MSVQHEVNNLVNETQEDLVNVSGVSSEESIKTALGEITTLLSATNESLFSICSEIETATSEDACRRGVRKFNSILRLLMVAAIDEHSDPIMRRAIASLSPSPQLLSVLASQESVALGVAAYMRLILKKLVMKICRRRTPAVVSEEQDDDLFARFYRHSSWRSPLTLILWS